MKRKSTAYRLFQAILILYTIFWLPVAVWAQETILTTIVPSSHTLYIELIGDGTVIVDGVAYTNSTEIQLPRHSKPQISLRAADGYKIKTILWEGENVTEAFKAEIWTGPSVTTDMRLNVILESNRTPAQTEDTPHVVIWLALSFIVACILLICLMIRRHRRK